MDGASEGRTRPSTAVSSPPPSLNGSSTTIADVDADADADADADTDVEIDADETLMCQRLTGRIASCLTNPSPLSLSRVLDDASRSIRYHAKWFAPEPLSTLLQTALHAASRSSSTTVLFKALELLDTITTYSVLLPLLPSVRFIAYSYYQASRSIRHQNIARCAWTVASRILASHLGGQFASALVQIISDPAAHTSKLKLAAATGALMLTNEKLLVERDVSYLSDLYPIQILLGVRGAAVGDNTILREQTTMMLACMLESDHLSLMIERDGALDVWLDVFGDCVWHAIDVDREALDSAFSALRARLPRFEARHRPLLAQLFVESRRPLPSLLSTQLVVPWQRSLMLDQDTMWQQEYRAVLGKLCDSSFYLEALDAFVHISVQAYVHTDDYVSRKDFVYTLESLITDPTTAPPAVDILATGIVKIFTYKTQKEKWEDQRTWLFSLLCGIAKHSLEATKLLLRLRADAEGQGYLAPDPDAERRTSPATAHEPACSDLYGLTSLSIDKWVETLHEMIADEPKRWEIYRALLTSLAPQIRNQALWRGRYHHINTLQKALCACLNGDSFVEPPRDSDHTKSQVIAELIQILTATITYHHHLPRKDIKAAVITILNVAGSRDHTVSIHCVHGLSICCYELPELMAGYMDATINKMTRMVTQRYLALYVLEFLAGLSRFPDLHDRLRREDFKKIFGVCHSYLQSIRSTVVTLERNRAPTSEHNAAAQGAGPRHDMAQYVYALAHHVIAFWYMALKRDDRHGLKEYITGLLKYRDSDDTERIEDQGMVTIDLMDRVDAEEQIDAPLEQAFDADDGRITVRNRITGVLLITTETSLRTGKTIVTIRRPSGTAQRTISSRKRHDSAAPAEVEARFTASVTVESDEQDYISVFPDDVSGRTYGKVAIPRPSSALGSWDIVELPDSEAVSRAIRQFDRTSALDSHKAGIIYVGEGQTSEREILLNRSGSPDYREFLEDMGSLRKLRGASFNTQGLDRADDADGEYTVVWNNDVTELVYHITTLMPHDPTAADDDYTTIINKKRHVGNDFVNIVFDNSGGDFRFDTFPSAFNLIYIVISPSERTSFLQARSQTATRAKSERFYNVLALARPGYPNLSSASDVKLISGDVLAGYVRNLTLNACLFSAMWQAGEQIGEYPSSWRQRLHMIRRMRERHRNPK